MALLATSEYSQEVFLGRNRLLLDSSALRWFADERSLDADMAVLQNTYQLVLPVIAILEVGFGPDQTTYQEQVEWARRTYRVAMDETIEAGDGPPCPPGLVVMTPSPHEYFAARDILIRMAQSSGTGQTRLDQRRNDALIYCCAWNCRAAIVTENLRDFLNLNRHVEPKSSGSGSTRQVPIYRVDDVVRSLEADVEYPENIPANLRNGL